MILTGTTNGSGVVVLSVPSGNSYNATATSSSGLTGTWGVHNVTFDHDRQRHGELTWLR